MEKNPYPGKFIVFEGPDGSGKTLQSELLTVYLRDLSREVVLTREPTEGSSVGNKIKDALSHKIKLESKELQRLFSEDRQEHLKLLIIPELKAGHVVVCDRYLFSTLAYGMDNVPVDELIAMNETFPLPDLTFVLDVDPVTCMERIFIRWSEDKEKKTELFEEEKKLRKIINNYRALKKIFPEMVFINGNRAPADIHAEIVEKVRPLFL